MNATKDPDDDGEMIAATLETVTAPAVIDLDAPGLTGTVLDGEINVVQPTKPKTQYQPFKW